MEGDLSREDILRAFQVISPYVHKTPVFSSESINKSTGCKLFFKCENFQKAGAFKSRGAVNAVLSLPRQELDKGVCTHSSGNHAQALARAAKLFGIASYIVMPENAPSVKINAVKDFGADIFFCQPNLDSREETLRYVQEKYNARIIHPYNDLRVICGQATAALEALNQIPEPDFIISPVGGGGLLSGTALSCHYFSPRTQVFGAEPFNVRDSYLSFHSCILQPALPPDTIADGLLTSLGTITFPIIQKHVKDILLTTESGIIKALKTIWEKLKIVVEPSSAVPLGAILENPDYFKNKTGIVVISGGNVDLNHLPWS